MNRIDLRFNQLREVGEGALVAFLVAGDPNFESSVELARLAVQAGADVLELGMPFSDAMADGPTIQRGYARALASGMTLSRVIDLVSRLRKEVEAPIVLMGYFNPILAYGVERFAQDLQRAGGDGVLVVDLPPEEQGLVQRAFSPRGLHSIFLVAPTSDERRIVAIAKQAQGYLYYVSLEGVTGTPLTAGGDIAGRLKSLRKRTNLPIVAGFGIRSGEQARTIGAACEGVVVGSALLEQIEGETLSDAKRKLSSRVKELKAALRRA